MPTNTTFTLSIELGNAAMAEPYDLAMALRRCADHIEAYGFQGDVEGRVRDVNGNTVGRWELG